jgi:periplasmic protein CpxP/Spy
MSETTETSRPSVPSGDSPRRRLLRRAMIASVIAAGAAGIGITALAHGGPGGWHRGGFLGGPLDPAALDERVDRMLKHLYVEIDATDTQKQQLAPIVKDAARDLADLRSRLREGRRQALALLSQPTIDRGALEALRVEQLLLAEQGSKRLAQALADVADALTPEQRKQLAERMVRWRRG